MVKKQLLHFWTFSGTSLKSVFLLNYKFILCLYKKALFLDFDNSISNMKSIFPLLHNISDNKTKILFIGSKCFFAQSFFFFRSKSVSNLTESKISTFTNFAMKGFKFFKGAKLKNSPSLIFFFNFLTNNYLLLESKKKNIPTISLVTPTTNSCLIDYPIFLNSFYFYNIYFFSRLFFRYILRLL